MGRIARRVHQAGVYFVTTDTWQRRQLFSKPEPGRILLEQILECCEKGFYKLHAFVIMPDHLHILLTPGDNTTLEKAMQMIKGGSSYRIKRQLGYKFPIWQLGYHDRWIRNAAEYETRKHYIEQNPVQERLVEKAKDFELSSACGEFVLDVSQFDHSGPGAKAQILESQS